MKHNKSFLLLTLCSLFWAGNYVVGNIIVNELSPLWVTFLRWLLSSFLLVPLAQLVEKPDWLELRKSWLSILLVSFTGFGFYNIILYTALSYTSAINATLINTFSPGLMALVSMLILKERLSKLQICGIIVSFLGVLVVLSRGSLEILLQAQFNKGDLIMFVALSSWIFYTITVKKITTIPPYTIIAASAVVSAVVLGPFALYEGIDMKAISMSTMIAVLYMAVFVSAVSFVFWSIGVRDVGAAKAGIFLNLITVFTAIISVMMGGELLPAQLYGGALVIIGVFLTTGVWQRKKRE